ncbi:MAG: hypothetical protein ABI607_03005 [Betaproteobacteria bacterium]
MNPREITAFVFTILATLPQAVAQSSAPNASPNMSGVATPQDEVKPPIRLNRVAVTDADARRCLEFATNLEVIVCAEKYRPRKRNA